MSKVAKRYAQGLLNFSNEVGQTDVVFSEMKALVKIIDESKELNRFFQTPFIHFKKKIAVAGEIFGSFSSASQNLIKLVIKRGRGSYLKDIARVFIDKVEDLKGVQRVSLISASQLSDNMVLEIMKSTSLVNIDWVYDLKTTINPEILGGYILRVGDQQIDASVRSKLLQIKKEFQNN